MANEDLSREVRLARADRVSRRARTRKLILLGLLLLLLALLAYTAYYWEGNRRLPLPTVTAPAKSMEPPQYLYSIAGTGADALTRPSGVAVGNDGRVYAVDFGKQNVSIFTNDGRFLSTFGPISDGGKTALHNPIYLAKGPNGDIWVTDRDLPGVYVFSPDGVFIRKFVPNNDPAFKWVPLGITLDAQGFVYISDVGDTNNHRILIFDPSGKLKVAFGTTEEVIRVTDSPGKFRFPNGLAVIGSGAKKELFVTDSNNRRVQVFDANTGKFKRFLQTSGTPRGIGFDSSGRLYVADGAANMVDIYSQTGKNLVSFGVGGDGPGQFRYPNQLALDARGRIYVTDRFHHMVQVWGFPVAEIPGVTKMLPGQQPWWCLLPLPLLLLPFFLRRRRFVVLPDFVEGMVTAELVREMAAGRWRWIMEESQQEAYEGRVEQGVDLGQLLEPEVYSHSDASALADQLGLDLHRAGLLVLGKRHKKLCTEDEEMARLGAALGIEVLDRQAFIERYMKSRSGRGPVAGNGQDVSNE